jgi:uncharacterized protein (UPF0332 family)
MTDEARGYLDKAATYIKSARLLYRSGDMDSAASRLYYAMFYCAEALLLSENLRFSSHRGVISSFGEKFVKKGRVAPKYHEWLRDAFDKRQFSDYRVLSGLGDEDVRLMVERAEIFLQLALKMLDQTGESHYPSVSEKRVDYKVPKTRKKPTKPSKKRRKG